MIYHKHKIIFIHIPRTGGSSIETAFVGTDWFYKDNKTKHMMASETKKLYKDYWDEYNKISIVRNPYDRAISLFTCKFNNIYCPRYKSDLSHFLQNFRPEHDEQKCIQCCDILDEPIDYIFKTSTLESDFNDFCEKLNIKDVTLPVVNKTTNRTHYRDYYNEVTKQMVSEMWRGDIEKYNFSF
jgi:chondroitin 4-sulfotransferase 11